MGNFHNIFKQLRMENGFTQVELAKKIGISRSTIAMYETGAREPDFETLEKIADFFDINTDFLLGRTNGTQNYQVSEHPVYYYNEDARETAQFLFENPEYKVLFDASRNVKKEDIDFVKEMIDRLSHR